MDLIRELLRSKKFVTALLGVITAVAVKYGIPEASVTELFAVVSPLLVYIGAQGAADFGKSAAQVDADPMGGGR